MLKLLKLGEELSNALLRPGTVDGGQPSFLRKKCDSKKNILIGQHLSVLETNHTKSIAELRAML